MYYIGIDIGGTFIKGGIADKNGKVILKDEVKTDSQLGADKVIEKTAWLIEKMLKDSNIGKDNIVSVGVGIPGLIDSTNGIVTYNNNLGWRNVHFADDLKKIINLPVYISNDANVAALGEAKYGAAKDYDYSVMVTLGTGVGGGVIINGKIFEGNMGAGAELGHMVIKKGGQLCTCGRKGCFESYSSATALIRQTKKAMEKDINTQMWKICSGNVDNVNGKTAFDCYYTDKTAKKVVDNYIDMLTESLGNLANIFRPQVILLGGGISKQGDMLINLIKKDFTKRLYANHLGPQVEIKLAALRNDAGFLGAIALAMHRHSNKLSS